DARNESSRPPQEKADAERTHLSEKRTAGDFDGAVGSKEGFTRLREKEQAMWRKPRPARHTFQQRTADLPLQIGNLFADGRLGDMQLAAGLTEASMVCDGAKVA